MKPNRRAIHRNAVLLVAACAFALAGHFGTAQAGSKALAPQATASKLDIRIPLQDKSVRFAVIGDSGTGDRAQYEVAQRMEAYRQATKFDFVIMLGDNIYGSHSPKDFVKKFEQPYKPLLDAGVKFCASLGNHDDPETNGFTNPSTWAASATMRSVKARQPSSRWTVITWTPNSSAG
jgi:hypothetical protein